MSDASADRVVIVNTREQILERLLRWIAEAEMREHPGTQYADQIRSLLWLLDDDDAPVSEARARAVVVLNEVQGRAYPSWATGELLVTELEKAGLKVVSDA